MNITAYVHFKLYLTDIFSQNTISSTWIRSHVHVSGRMCSTHTPPSIQHGGSEKIRTSKALINGN